VADAGGTLDATAAAFRARRHGATSAGGSAPRGGLSARQGEVVAPLWWDARAGDGQG
jgi:hypothetical protein